MAGRNLEYDPRYRGPSKRRSCTDLFCLIIFVVFLIAWGVVGYYAYKNGNPSKLLVPTDSEGRKCGVDSEVLNRTYLVFFDITKCVDVKNNKLGKCDTPQICVSSCPDKTFVYPWKGQEGEDPKEITNDMICKDEVNPEGKNWKQLNKYVEKGLCAAWYLKSRSVANRCFPDTNIDIPNDLSDLGITDEKLQSAVDAIKWVARAEEFVRQSFEDIKAGKQLIITAIILSAVVSLLLIIILRWFTLPFVVVSIIGVYSALIYATYESYRQYTLTDNNSWLYGTIALGIVLVILLLTIFFLRKRISLACKIIEEASKAVTSVLSSLVFPLVPWALHLAMIAYGVSLILYMESAGDRTYKIEVGSEGNCKCSEKVVFGNGVTCDPDVFNKECREDGEMCYTSGCHLDSEDMPWFINYIRVINAVGIFWTFFFISAFGEMVLAAVFATWYWTFRKSEVPFFTVTASIYRVVRYHLGTLAFGALIITICRLIRIFIEYLSAKAKQANNDVVKNIFRCFSCCFWILEKFLKFMNKNAYIMCAIHGKGLIRSAKDAFDLLVRNLVRVYVLNKLTEWLLLLGKLLVMVLSIGCTWLYIRQFNSSTFNNMWVPVAVIGVGSYLASSVFFSVHASAIDTLFLCFLEDSERNDGSRERPYFMSKKLRKLLNRK